LYDGYVTQTAGWPDLDDEALLIAVANTGHREDDEFADPRAATAWWRELGATRAPAGYSVATSGDLDMLRALRAVIRRAALRNNGIDIDVDTAALDGLALRPDLSGDPSLRAGTAGDLTADLCAGAIAALLRASARPGWPRFKACRGTDCHLVFIDSSRNTSRRWCDMAACGNRAKGESFRVRHRAAGASR
jgi:predicted RNA-binding Zn ribbon-like protein